MKRRTFLLTAAAALVAGSPILFAVNEPLVKDDKNLSFRNEIRDVMNRGIAFVASQQNPDGSFGKDVAHPALSALPLVALQRDQWKCAQCRMCDVLTERAIGILLRSDI